MERRSLTGKVKRAVRHVVDRVMVPYVEDLRAEIRAAEIRTPGPAAPEPAPNVVSERFHNLTHALRTMALESSPKGARRVLSVGASGRWYFDWFEACIGPVEEHIGVEAFEEQPADLPPYVRWVANTADRLEDVADSSVDLVFAGQTIEHLWAHELGGFLIEAHRVLAPGGWIVLDSPNRLVTEHLRWSHGGHTIEVSLGEMVELLELAGFQVATARGIWRCRFEDRIFDLEDELHDDELVARRIASADARPDDSFIWWVEARRTGTAPRAEELHRRVSELFEQHWDTRVCRGMWEGPPATDLAVLADTSGVISSSLPFPIHAGQWTLTMTLEEGVLSDLDDWCVAIVAPAGNVIHMLEPSGADVTATSACWRFRQEELLFALAIEVRAQRVRRRIRLRVPLELRNVVEPSLAVR